MLKLKKQQQTSAIKDVFFITYTDLRWKLLSETL